MSDVLIRDVPAEDLDDIKAAAAAQGVSVQGYLRAAVHAQAVYLRRRAVLGGIAERLAGRPAVPDEDRQGVLAAVDRAHDQRAHELVARPAS